jgi:hypothetical protein
MHVFFANPEPLFVVADRLETHRTNPSITPIVSVSLKGSFLIAGQSRPGANLKNRESHLRHRQGRNTKLKQHPKKDAALSCQDLNLMVPIPRTCNTHAVISGRIYRWRGLTAGTRRISEKVCPDLIPKRIQIVNMWRSNAYVNFIQYRVVL